MNLLLSLLISCMMSSACAVSWLELLQQHRGLMGESCCALLMRQYTDYREGKAPAIADQRIKNIPLYECGEPCVSVRDGFSSRIRLMEGDELLACHQCPEDIDPRAVCCHMVRTGVYEALVRTVAELDAIASAFGYEPGDLDILLFEGLRDLATQKELFDGTYCALHAAHPEMTDAELYAETSKLVSPYVNNVPTHSTGAAVDIHLWSTKHNGPCDMGRFNTGGALAPTFSEDEHLTDAQKQHRCMLLIAITRAGLTNYVYEFWHMSYGDRYAAYWREPFIDARVARYNAQ